MRGLAIVKKMILTRPLIPVFLAVLLWSAFYSAFLWNYPSIEARGYDNNVLTGKVNAKEYNEDGTLKYIVVEDVLVYFKSPDDLTDVVIGSNLEIKGKIEEIEPTMNRGEFNSKYYNAVRGRFFQMGAESMRILNTPDRSLKESILRLKLRAFELLREYCPLEYGTVATLIFADKRGISEERKRLYRRVGCAHFLVISGLHVSIFGGMLYRLFRRIFGLKPLASFLTLAILILYGIFAGFGVSVIRAVIMFSIRLAADLLKENYDMLNAVMLAAVITLFGNPLYVGDSSFIYSYGTVFSLALYLNVSGLQSNKPENMAMRICGLLKIPCVIMVAMLPVTLFLSYEYSLLSIVANLILMPMSVPVLVLSLLAMLFSSLGLSFLAGTMDFFLTLMLRGFDYICRFITYIPGTEIWGKPKILQLIFYYVPVLAFLFFLHKKSGMMVKITFYGSMIAMVSTVFLFRGYLSMLYVGQGECIIIRTTCHSAIMIDAGSTSEETMYEYRLLPFLKAEGITKLDAVFVTHGDADHTNGVTALINNLDETGLQIGSIICSEYGAKVDKGVVELINLAKNNGIEVNMIGTGVRLSCRNWNFICLLPEPQGEYSDTNDASLCLYGQNTNSGFDILLLGDAGAEAEKRITEIININKYIYLLKTAHHGSKYSTSTELLERFNFNFAIISAGKGNIYGHPHQATLNRLEKYGIDYLVTKDFGEIDIFTE